MYIEWTKSNFEMGKRKKDSWRKILDGWVENPFFGGTVAVHITYISRGNKLFPANACRLHVLFCSVPGPVGGLFQEWGNDKFVARVRMHASRRRVFVIFLWQGTYMYLAYPFFWCIVAPSRMALLGEYSQQWVWSTRLEEVDVCIAVDTDWLSGKDSIRIVSYGAHRYLYAFEISKRPWNSGRWNSQTCTGAGAYYLKFEKKKFRPP